MINRHELERVTQAIRDEGDRIGVEMTTGVCRSLAVAALKASRARAILYRENTSTEAELRLQFEWADDKPWPASVRACKGESAGYDCKLYRPAAPDDKALF